LGLLKKLQRAPHAPAARLQQPEFFMAANPVKRFGKAAIYPRLPLFFGAGKTYMTGAVFGRLWQ
jgi:hypothetical protein